MLDGSLESRPGTHDQPEAAHILLDLIAERLSAVNGSEGLDLADRVGILAHRLEYGDARARTPSGLSAWGEAVLSLKCAEDLMEATGDDEAEVDRAADLQLKALVALLTTPAPDASALAHKLEVFAKHQAWGFRETPAVVEVLADDAGRFAGEAR